MVRPNETRQYVHDPRRYQSRLRLPNGVQEVSVWQEPRPERGFFFAGRSACHRAAPALGRVLINRDCSAIAGCRKRPCALFLFDYEEFIGAKKQLVLAVLSNTGPAQSSCIGSIG